MKITDLAIKYRTVIAVLTLLLTGAGVYSYLTIPKESAPSLDIPYVIVTTPYPGASPEDVENIVTQEIEQEIQDINGIEEIRSTSREGLSQISVEFNPDENTTEAYRKVQDEVSKARPDLPDGAEEPVVTEVDVSEFPIMTVNLSAEYSLARLKEVAEDLQDELEGISTVLEAQLTGGLTREVQINVDLAALKGYDLSFQDFINTIQQENTSIPGGDIDVDDRNYLIRVDGRFTTPEVIENLVIKSTNGNNVYVRDVADVVFGFEERSTYARMLALQEENAEGELVTLEGSESEMKSVISLGVKKRPGTNIIETVENVEAAIGAFPMPSGTQVTITGDQSENVQTMVTDLQNNIISGLIFVVLVLLFFMGVRNATLVGIAIPLSMFVTFLFFNVMGYTLNFVILFSLIIALGMLVDNAIVVVENIYRFREQGYSRFEAARLGTAEVGGAVIAATFTTVGAFFPMLFWPGISGQFMSYMPLTLIITLLCSLFVALIINPVITGFFVKLPDEYSEEPMEDWIKYTAIGSVLLLGIVIGLVNWKTLVVIAVATPLLYYFYTKLLKPVGDRFMEEGLPRLIAWYRDFLERMLERDYTADRALLRNAGALAALSAGFAVSILGGALYALAGPIAGMIFLVPGGLLAAVGILGVLFHTFESLYLGGRTTFRAGLWTAAIMAVVVGLMFLSTEVSLATAVVLMLVPVVIAGLGFLGMTFNTHEQLILTDNRARLLTGSLGALFLIVALYAMAPTGVAFFPDTDPSQVQATLDAPLGTNVESSNRLAAAAMNRVRNLMEEDPAVKAAIKNMVVNVGVGGNATFGGGQAREERTQITFNMVDFADRVEPSTVTQEKLRKVLTNLRPGVEVELTTQGMGPSTGPPVNIEITGPEFDQISEIVGEVRRELDEASIAGLTDVTDNLNQGRPEVKVVIDRERAQQFGLSTRQVASAVRSAVAGTDVGEFRDGEDEYDIVVQLRKEDRQNIESLNSLTIPYEGNQIPLTAVASLEEGAGYGSITRQDLSRVAIIEGSAEPGYTGNEVLGRVQQALADYRENMPPGYSLEYTGQQEDQQESFNFLFTALAIGIALIFMVLIAQFNSLSAPFIIMVAVGLGLIGVLLGLILTRTPFSLFTFIGVISLAGIIVNNNIVLVDYVMQLRQRGEGKKEAIIDGGATRLRPVVLTALTTVLGLVPLTFGINVDFVGLLTDFAPNFQVGSSNTQFWGPMGTAIIAGLTFGTFLTLVIVPVMYSTFDSLGVRWAQFRGKDASEAGLVSDAVGTEVVTETNGQTPETAQPAPVT